MCAVVLWGRKACCGGEVMHASWGGMPAVVEEKCLVLAGKKGRICGGGVHAVLL